MACCYTIITTMYAVTIDLMISEVVAYVHLYKKTYLFSYKVTAAILKLRGFMH